jgi:plastocyanin
MTDTFDSRALRATDCYGQRFMKAGLYRYHVLSAHAHCMTDERPFAVKVGESSGKRKLGQNTVTITFDRGRFRVEPQEVTIESGDLVLWNCPNARANPYMVVGDKEFFGSSRLVNESGYSHAFASPGEYTWRDAYGSGASGTVRVTDPGCRTHADLEQWRRTLRKGTLITIDDRIAHPRDVAIVTGQTVFFAITKGPGISITDERLLMNRDASRSERS